MLLCGTFFHITYDVILSLIGGVGNKKAQKGSSKYASDNFSYIMLVSCLVLLRNVENTAKNMLDYH